jgi:hypothetical protein
MAQFQGQFLPPNHPVTRRVREIAKRIVERNGLGRVKEGHSLSSIEEVMGSFGMGRGMESGENIDATEAGNQNAEWEVSPALPWEVLMAGVRRRRQEDDERIRDPR